MIQKWLLGLAAIVSTGCASNPDFLLSGPPSSPTPLSLRWVPCGPNPCSYDPADQLVSGRVSALQVDSRNPERMWLGTAGGGVWSTVDGGKTWRPLTDDAPCLAIGSLLQDPDNLDTILAGTGEAVESADAQAGKGILVSQDGGVNFRLMKGSEQIFSKLSISKLVRSKEHSLWVTTLAPSQADRENSQSGVYRIKTGSSFERVFPAPGVAADVTDFLELADGSLLAAIESSDDRTRFPAGIWRSDDRGSGWTRITRGLPPLTSRIELAAAARPGWVYALVEGGLDQPNQTRTGTFSGVFLSRDSGGQWVSLTGPSGAEDITTPLGGQAGYNMGLVVDPTDERRVYVAGDARMLRLEVQDPQSGLCGITTFPGFYEATSATVKDLPHPDFHALVLDRNGRLLAGTDGGLWRLERPETADPTSRWANLNGNPGEGLETLQFVGLTVDPRDPTRMVGGTQDNSTMRAEGRVWRGILLADGGPCQFDSVHPDILYESTQDILFRSELQGLQFPQNFDQGLNKPKGTFYIPMEVTTVGGRCQIIVATDSIYRRFADEARWTPISPPQPNLASALGLMADRPGHMFVGYGKGQVYLRTPDGFELRNQGLPLETPLEIDVVPAKSDEVFACFGSKGVYFSQNSGRNWSRLTSLHGRSLVIDGGALYLGTDTGVMVSKDGGQNWISLGVGLPNVQISRLVVTGQVLTAATYGRGVWQLDLSGNPRSSPPAHKLQRVLPLLPDFIKALDAQMGESFKMEAWLEGRETDEKRLRKRRNHSRARQPKRPSR